MITSFTKRFYKCPLLGLTAILLISGCGMTNANLDENPYQVDNAPFQTDHIENETTDGQQLAFSPVPLQNMAEGEPKTEWKKEQSIPMGEVDGESVLIHLYTDDIGNSTFGFLEHRGKQYVLSDVAGSIDDVKVETINQPFNGILQVLMGIGTSYTTWEVVAYDATQGAWTSFETIGRPQIIDLDGDGMQELVANFEGAHLNFPNVEIVRVNNGRMDSARVIDTSGSAEDPQYARLFHDNGRYLIEIGNVREDVPGRKYRYEDGSLVEQNYAQSPINEEVALQFAAVKPSELPPAKPEEGLEKVKSAELQIGGENVLVDFYQGPGKPNEQHDIYAFLNDGGQTYSIGLATSFNLEGINEIIATDVTGDGQNELLISGVLGASYAELKVIGYDAQTKHWLNLLTMGTLEIVDLDGDGKPELVAVSAGSIPSYVQIYRWNQDYFEMADVAELLGNVYATLVEQEGTTLIQTGTDDAKKLYRYADGKLVEAAAQQAD
jgi:hypothetical protein